ncbi:GntR family transcriptional regulator [Chelativorans xinjiangense]|uniref:GntR family transcriptional regulator n=1 Tax=Chelativorans xinjiangense TaxID=2681485 RepID=UPI00135CB811|nr:GntR family transcriptional regulator [Chelativorans xinjiangense]
MLKSENGLKTLRAEAYGRIVDLLNTQEVHPGQVVTQRELVERTNTSLAAVREAIPRLEAEGLIVTLRQRGLMFPNVDVAFIRNAYQLRVILELEAIANVPRNIQPSTIEDWEREHRDILRRLQEDATEELARKAQALDWGMHEQLIRSLGNDLIAEVYRVNAIKVRMAAQKRLLVTPLNAIRVMNEHLAILEALRRQKGEGAAAAMRKHIGNSMQLALGGEID